MAELPVIDNVTRVAFNWGPIVATNVMHFHQDDVDYAGLYGAIDANVTSSMWQSVQNGQRVESIIMTQLDGTAGSESFLPPNVAKWKGQGGGEPICNLATVLSMRTALRGRSARGRAFLGPVGETSNASGFHFVTLAVDMATAWTAFGENMVVDGVQHVIASYKLASALTVTNYSVRNAFGTVRLRQSRLAA